MRPNIHMHVASVLSLPEDWSESFDLVHQRFMVGALRVEDWPVALAELFRVLKPEGGIQLVEFVFKSPCEDGPMRRHFDLLGRLFQSHGLLREVATELPGLLRTAGFVNVAYEEKIVPFGNAREWGEDAAAQANNHISILRETGHFVVGAGLIGSQKEYDELLEDYERELREKGTLNTVRMICARKPIAAGSS